MSDPEKEIAKEIYDRSFTEGVLPNDIGIDAVPTEDKPSTSTPCIHHMGKVVETWFYKRLSRVHYGSQQRFQRV